LTNQSKKDYLFGFTLEKLLYICIVDKNQKHRNITFYKNYFQDFFDKQNDKVKAKIVWTFELVEDLQRVPETYLKHIENTSGLYEIRVQLGSDIFRIFCFFDQGQLVVLANGFQKKTQKTPKKEIEMAIKIKEEYELEIANTKR
jgi:phage-related protein